VTVVTVGVRANAMAPKKPAGPVPLAAVEHAITILDALGAAPAGLDLNAVAETASMSAAGAYRTLQTLRAGGLVSQDGRRGTYRLGPKVLVLAQSMRSDAALVAAAEPALRDLSRATGESVALAVVRDRRIWGIASVTGEGEVVARPRLAHGEPYFHTTGRGKLYLASLPRDEARAVIAATGLPQVGPNTITDETELWRAVDQARECGYAVNRRERSEHLGGLAFPVWDRQRRLAATIGITVPIFRLDEAHEARLVAHGLAAADRVTRALRGDPLA
jgi:IclR family acetate operon transcriptional repressor